MIISRGFEETGAVKEGIIKRDTPSTMSDMSMLIYSGPHFYLGSPIYKKPRTKCVLNSDYDIITLTNIKEDYIPTTNFIPNQPLPEFTSILRGFPLGQNKDGKEYYSKWIDYYKVAMRRMTGGCGGERTVTTAIFPPLSSHLHTITSVIFKNQFDLIDFTSMTSSIVLDYIVKVSKINDILPANMQSFPLGVAPQYQSALYSRTLLLNCLTTHYADLWRECWRDDYAAETWSIRDPRLKPFKGLTQAWEWSTPLRNYFERRQALVEIDVIAAMALGLSLEDLEMIYNIQFPVLQQNENDTWYDRQGNIVFTCSKGLTGVGVDRKTWEAIRGEALDNLNNPTNNNPNNPITSITLYKGASSSFIHTIDPAKSELYGGQEVTYLAPYTRCNRIADYRRAWAHFEKVFENRPPTANEIEHTDNKVDNGMQTLK